MSFLRVPSISATPDALSSPLRSAATSGVDAVIPVSHNEIKKCDSDTAARLSSHGVDVGMVYSPRSAPRLTSHACVAIQLPSRCCTEFRTAAGRLIEVINPAFGVPFLRPCSAPCSDERRHGLAVFEYTHRSMWHRTPPWKRASSCPTCFTPHVKEHQPHRVAQRRARDSEAAMPRTASQPLPDSYV